MSFMGDIEQIPSMYSAIKYEGSPHKLAREGKTVERKPRAVTIYDIRILRIEGDELEFEVDCSKGTTCALWWKTPETSWAVWPCHRCTARLRPFRRKDADPRATGQYQGRRVRGNRRTALAFINQRALAARRAGWLRRITFSSQPVMVSDRPRTAGSVFTGIQRRVQGR